MFLSRSEAEAIHHDPLLFLPLVAILCNHTRRPAVPSGWPSCTIASDCNCSKKKRSASVYRLCWKVGNKYATFSSRMVSASLPELLHLHLFYYRACYHEASVYPLSSSRTHAHAHQFEYQSMAASTRLISVILFAMTEPACIFSSARARTCSHLSIKK